MADLDNIKDVVLTYADQYAREMAARAPRDTGRLANSYRGVAKMEQGKFIIEVYGEDYGKVIGGPLPFGARFNIAQNGLKPQPFLQDAIDVVNSSFIADLEDAGVKDVEQYFDTLSKVEIK